jgi:hypothetical protein
MTHGARTRGGQLEILWPSFCLTGVLSGFRTFLVLRWTSPGMILGEVASRCGFTWCLSLPMWGGRCGRASLPFAPAYDP